MSATIGLEQVLHEEDLAWKMAVHIAELASRECLGDLHGELAALHGFLATELEIHLDREEADLFPVLATRGLEVEVSEAKRQHARLRALREDLGGVPETETAALRRALLVLSEALQHHIRYEADFIYCDLKRCEATMFREDLDLNLEAAAPTLRRPLTA
jgi:hypothetical protein